MEKRPLSDEKTVIGAVGGAIIIDFGKIVNDKSQETDFFNNMGAGFDARIAIETNCFN